MRSPILFSLGFIGSLGLLIGCGEVPPSPEASAVSETMSEETQPQQTPLNIMVSVLPQKYFVEKIGGDRVNVSVLVGKGIEPENYEPKPQQLKDLSNADAYIAMGVFFEDVWGDRLKGANQNMKWLDASEGVEKLPLTGHDHDHGEEKAAEEGDLLDPHIWLSPKRVKQQAENIYQLLSQLDPANEAIYAQNLGVFLKEIDELDQAIAEQLKPLENRSFLIFHPSFGYFADDYDLEQLTIEIEGQEPSAAELTQLITTVKEKELRVIFAQVQFSAKSAETIAKEINAEVVMIDPLAENWAENLLEITNQLVLANSPQP